jgi:hypothetical protein
LIDFQAVLLLEQIKIYKVVRIMAYLPRLDVAVRPNGKFAFVSKNSMYHFQVVISLCAH